MWPSPWKAAMWQSYTYNKKERRQILKTSGQSLSYMSSAKLSSPFLSRGSSVSLTRTTFSTTDSMASVPIGPPTISSSAGHLFGSSVSTEDTTHIALDIADAFDRVWHPGLIFKLSVLVSVTDSSSSFTTTCTTDFSE